MNKVHQKALEIKMAGTAIECGTLDVLLHLLPAQTPVLLMPLSMNATTGTQYKQYYAVHVTARASQSSPILYATFHAAQALQLAGNVLLIDPYRLKGPEAETRAVTLQQEMLICLCQLIAAHSSVSSVVTPVRFRLLDEWVWNVCSQEPRIALQDGHWQVGEEVSHV